MNITLIIMIITGAITLFGGIVLMYAIYNMTIIDASIRGLKHPKMWGVFNIGGQNSGGNILLYLFARRKYPVRNLSTTDQVNLLKFKKKATLALAFHIVGGIGFIISFFLYF